MNDETIKQEKCAIEWCIALATTINSVKPWNVPMYCTVHSQNKNFKPEDFKGSPWDKVARHVRS